jgi:hypothetical protein
VGKSPGFCRVHCHRLGTSMADTEHPDNFWIVSQQKAGRGIISRCGS